MRRSISIRGCVRSSVSPYVRPVLFSKVKSTHTRRILCRVSGLVFSINLQLVPLAQPFAVIDHQVHSYLVATQNVKSISFYRKFWLLFFFLSLKSLLSGVSFSACVRLFVLTTLHLPGLFSDASHCFIKDPRPVTPWQYDQRLDMAEAGLLQTAKTNILPTFFPLVAIKNMKCKTWLKL